MYSPFISIFLPVFNAEQYIDKCLNSILEPGLQKEEIEIVIIDDGSIDRTGEICDKYAKQNEKIRVIHQENQGVMETRKRAADECKGKYILCIDADDYFDKGYILGIMNALQQQDDVDILIWGYRKVDERGAFVKECNLPYRKDQLDSFTIDEIREQYLYSTKLPGINGGCLFFSMWSKAIRREIYYEAVRTVPNNIVIGEDLLITLYALFLSTKVSALNNIGYNYRINSEGLTQKIRMEQFDNHKLLLNELCKVYESHKEMQNSICAYSVYSTYNLLYMFMRNNGGIIQYIKGIRKIQKLDLFYGIHYASFGKISKREKIKLFCIKHRIWPVLYINLLQINNS